MCAIPTKASVAVHVYYIYIYIRIYMVYIYIYIYICRRVRVSVRVRANLWPHCLFSLSCPLFFFCLPPATRSLLYLPSLFVCVHLACEQTCAPCFSMHFTTPEIIGDLHGPIPRACQPMKNCWILYITMSQHDMHSTLKEPSPLELLPRQQQEMKNKKPYPPPGKLTWQWKIHVLKMYFILRMVIFQCHLSFQGCNLHLLCHLFQDLKGAVLGRGFLKSWHGKAWFPENHSNWPYIHHCLNMSKIWPSFC